VEVVFRASRANPSLKAQIDEAFEEAFHDPTVVQRFRKIRAHAFVSDVRNFSNSINTKLGAKRRSVPRASFRDQRACRIYSFFLTKIGLPKRELAAQWVDFGTEFLSM